MKKIFLVLAIAAAAFAAVDAQAQNKSPEAAMAAVEKAAAATENPKQSAKPATWIKYGNALLDAYTNPAGNGWLGMSLQEMMLLGGGEKPQSESTVNVGGRTFTKQVYETRNYYFNENGLLEIIEITKPVLDNALDLAFDAFKTAAINDPDGKKTKDITAGLQTVAMKFSDEAYSDYTLGDYSAASVMFEKAADVAGTAPLSQLDTNSIYNAAYSAWVCGENERSKDLFLRGIDAGYYGTDGESYAKLADIATKLGDEAGSLKYLEEGFAKFPNSQSILVGLINYYVKSGENTTRLFELIDEAKKNEPNNPSLYYTEGDINEKLGNGDAAVAAYRKCAEIDPNYEFGYIGEGIHFYNLAAKIQQQASEELDDAKYMALMGEFETALKACIPPFEKAFEVTQDSEVKLGVAEYLKNAYYRFISEGDEYQQKYDKYNEYLNQN